MIRDDARLEAGKWLESLHLPPVHGRTIDLRGPARQVKFAGYFRTLVFRNAVKQLTREGASVIPPDPQG